MSKTRRMYVSTSGLEAIGADLNEGVVVSERKVGAFKHTVLVTDARDAPDFEVGDRVRSPGRGECVVAAQPFEERGVWWVPIRLKEDPPGVAPMLRSGRDLTKIPREKTVTLRVPGVVMGAKLAREIEEAVERWQDFYGVSIDMTERVEDES